MDSLFVINMIIFLLALFFVVFFLFTYTRLHARQQIINAQMLQDQYLDDYHRGLEQTLLDIQLEIYTIEKEAHTVLNDVEKKHLQMLKQKLSESIQINRKVA